MRNEWLAISLVFGLLVLLAVSANYSHVRAGAALNRCQPPKDLQITIVGAVEKPGLYVCRPGAQLQQILAQAGVKKNANRRKIPYKKNLFVDQTIEIVGKKTRNSQGEKISLVEKPELCYDLTS